MRVARDSGLSFDDPDLCRTDRAKLRVTFGVREGHVAALRTDPSAAHSLPFLAPIASQEQQPQNPKNCLIFTVAFSIPPR